MKLITQCNDAIVGKKKLKSKLVSWNEIPTQAHEEVKKQNTAEVE